MSGPVLARSQKNFQFFFSRMCDSSTYFYTKFYLILIFIFTSYKYKFSIQIPGFCQKKIFKNVFVFIHTAKSLKAKKLISYNKEKLKKNVLSCILVLITSLLKSQEFGQYFKKIQKNYFVSLYIRDYEFTRKAYSRY
jgi:hypothetical protein